MIVASILLVVGGSVWGSLLLAAYRLKRTEQYKAVIENDVFLDQLHKACLEARDVEPFAGTLADEILKHRVERFNKSVTPKGK